MLCHPLRAAVGNVGGNKSLSQIISDLGLTTNLKLCLDAGDANSYDPAVQTDKWLDVSGNGYDLFRGSVTGSDAADPTFNGTAGGLSDNEYFSYDGGDWFTYDSTLETWMNNLHKNNAIFTIVTAFYKPSLGDAVRIVTTRTTSTTSPGIYLRINSDDTFTFLERSNQIFTSTAQTTAGWNILAMSFNEGSSSLSFMLNGAAESASVSYTSPSTTNSSLFRIGTAVATTNPNPAGIRTAVTSMWEGTALTSQNLADLYDALKGRFGL